MAPYEIEALLANGSNAVISFAAWFLHFEREWEVDGVTVQIVPVGVGYDDYLEELVLDELDEAARLTVQGAIKAHLDNHTPSESESEAACLIEKGDHDFHCHHESQD